LVAQGRDLRVGKLPARLIVVIRLRQSRAAHCERRQNCADEVQRERHHREILLYTLMLPGPLSREGFKMIPVR
jgi:hypothetical protein